MAISYEKLIPSRKLFNRPLWLYFAAALILVTIGDLNRAHVRRFNGLSDWGNYPVYYSVGGEPWGWFSFRMAIRCYKAFATVFPHSARGEEMVGYCYFQLRDSKQARRYYEKAFKKQTEYFWLDYNLGMIHFAAGNMSAAEACFLRVVQGNPADQERYAILSPLNSLKMTQRVELYQLAQRFTLQVREDSLRMLLLIRAKISGKAEEGNNSEVRLILHPWAYYIPIGKEIFI